MRTRRMLAGVVSALLVLLTTSFARADFLHGFWEWATGQAPKQPEDAPKAGAVVVSGVTVRGSFLVLPGTVLAQVKTRPGAPFSPQTLEMDAQAVRDSRQFASVATEVCQDGPGRVKVCFVVRDLPRNVEKVTYLGARHLSEKDLAALTGIHVGLPLNPDLNRLACRKIVAYYNASGRPFASCTLLKGGGPNGSEVLFSVTEGPQVAVRDVRFDGNNLVRSSVLAGCIRSGTALQASGGKFDPALAAADAGELEKYYRSLGCNQVQVSRELQWDEGGRTVSLVFHIDEGTRYRAAEEPPPPAAPVAAASEVRLAARETVAPAAPARESPPVKIGKIHVAGNRVTPTAVILAQSGLAPGQMVFEADLRKAEAELAKLAFFEVDAANDVRPTVTVLDSEGEVKDLLIFVKEKQSPGWSAGEPREE